MMRELRLSGLALVYSIAPATPLRCAEGDRDARRASTSSRILHVLERKASRNWTGDIPVDRRNAQANALGLSKPTEILTSETLLPPSSISMCIALIMRARPR